LSTFIVKTDIVFTLEELGRIYFLATPCLHQRTVFAIDFIISLSAEVQRVGDGGFVDFGSFNEAVYNFDNQKEVPYDTTKTLEVRTQNLTHSTLTIQKYLTERTRDDLKPWSGKSLLRAQSYQCDAQGRPISVKVNGVKQSSNQIDRSDLDTENFSIRISY
jgi:hypothetical protein